VNVIATYADALLLAYAVLGLLALFGSFLLRSLRTDRGDRDA
jgi:hypothetical protein